MQVELIKCFSNRYTACSGRVVLMKLFFLVVVWLSACTRIPDAAMRGASVPEVDSMAILIVENYPEVVLSDVKVDMSQFTKRLLNVPYTADVLCERQQLDIIYPDGSIGPYRVIVAVHGGGWMTGDKQSESLAPLFEVVNQGYALITVNYRLSGDAPWPAQLHDLKAAMRFLRANGDMYRLNTDKIVVWGVSTGGHLAMMLAATNNQVEFEDLSMGNENYSSSVQGVVSWCGASDLAELSEASTVTANRLLGVDVKKERARTLQASPLFHVSEEFPPLLLVHGTEDKFISYRQSVNMLHKVNIATGDLRAELVTFEGGEHCGPMMKSSYNVLNNLDFVDKIYYTELNPYRSENVKDIKLDFDEDF
jgi:acetyl esterase/lipase